MPLDFQIQTAPFRMGIEEGQDPKQIPFGALTTCENLEWVKSGRLQKRDGIALLTDEIPSVARLFTRGDELCAVTKREAAGTRVYSMTSTGPLLAGNRGLLADVGLEWRTLQSGYNGVYASDAALLSNDHVVHAWLSGDPIMGGNNELCFQVFDRTTGVEITKVTKRDAGTTPYSELRVLASGTHFIILLNSNGAIACSYDGGLFSTLVAAATTTGIFDACVIESTGQFDIAYALDTLGIGMRRYTFADPPVQQATAALTGETTHAIVDISIDDDDLDVGTLWVAYAAVVAGSGQIRYAVAHPTTLATVTTPVTVDSTAGIVNPTVAVVNHDGDEAFLAYSVNGNGATDAYRDGFTSCVSIARAGGALLTVPTVAYNVKLISRPFAVSGAPHAVVANFLSSTGIGFLNKFHDGGTYLVDMTQAAIGVSPYAMRYIGRVNTLDGGNWAHGQVSNIITVTADEEYLSLCPFFSAVPQALHGWLQGTQLVTINANAGLPEDMWRCVTIGLESYLAAGVLQAYDGNFVFDSGFAHEPIIELLTTSTSGGAMDSAGNYIYAVTPEYRSNAGVLHRGPVSVKEALNIASGSSGSMLVAVIPVHLSSKFNSTTGYPDTPPVSLVIHRSVEAGLIVQRLTAEPAFNVLLQGAFSSPNIFTDTRNDNDIEGIGAAGLDLAVRPAMYTEGGELEDMQAPALLTIVAYRNRIFGISGDRHTIWFTKDTQRNPGVAPGFNPDFRITINDALRTMDVLDDRLVIFSDTGIYVMAGDGPAPNGDGDFGAVTKLQTDVGCTNARCRASTSDGIFFESSGQIYLLDRKLNVNWISKPVQDTLALYPTITSAVVHSKKNQVRFSCVNLDGFGGPDGVVLVYDYAERQWSVFRYLTDYGDEFEAGTGLSLAIVDALMYRGVYTFATSDGIVYQEDATTSLDDGAYVISTMETAWINARGPLAYDSVRRFMLDGVSLGAHGLEVSVGFNGNTTYQQGPRVFAEGIADVTATGPMSTCRVTIGTRRKCRSIRFKIQDTAPVTLGTGRGAIFSTMALEVGSKKGLGKLAVAAQR